MSMSLDVYLSYEEDGNDINVYSSNITHNLGRMAEAAGMYKALWRPEEEGWTKARDIAPVIEAGLQKMKEDPALYKRLDAANGWGTYDQFIPWIEQYLEACKKYPSANVSVWR